tara:strand:- start:424 stop:729 length:306 start_codon:yes stop_codon:yes gene_type:complete
MINVLYVLLVHIHQLVPNLKRNVFHVVTVSIPQKEAVMYQNVLIVLRVNLHWRVVDYPTVLVVLRVSILRMALQYVLIVLLDNIQIRLNLRHVPLVPLVHM